MQSRPAHHHLVAAWLGVDPQLLCGIDPAVIQRIASRRDELEEARDTIEAYVDLATTVRRKIVGLAAEARTDPLTGILNRRGLDECLEGELGRAMRTGEPLSVIVIDVDGLKRVNDDLGHAAGDDVLRATASAIRSELRVTDRLGRTGGDEFLAALPATDAGSAEQVAQRIEVSARHLRILTAPERRLGVSTGWASTSEERIGFPQLIAVADERLYEERRRRLGASGVA